MDDYRHSIAVHIFADTEAALTRMRVTAATAGCRAPSARLLSDGVESPGITAPGSAILVELEDEASGEAALPLLEWLLREAERGTRRAVVSAPVGLIDLVAASAGHEAVIHLCEADESERLAAIARTVEPVVARVRDDGAARLLQPSPDYATDTLGPDDLNFIRTLIRARRLRDEHFPAELFADPAWDIMLDLMAARLERKPVTVSSLCVAAAVPPTTALRWIADLTARGLLVRIADPQDRRRAYIELSDATVRALGGWLRRTRRLAAEAL